MRKWFAIILLVAASGCLESQLSPGEAQLCLQSTSIQPSVIPECKSTVECEKKLIETFPAQTFQNINIGADSILARKGISGAWDKLNRATQTIEQVHESCTTMKAVDLLPLTVTSASELQNALKASEEAQKNTYRALEKTITYGKTLELEKVKDTEAFEEYALLVQQAQDLETGNPTSEWAQAQKENNDYFENITKIIAKNKTPNYEISWNSIFGAYKTGVTAVATKQARGVLAVSPLWQGALSAFVGKSKSTNALSIATEIKGNEVIEHVEQVVSPENGIVTKIWKEILGFDQKISQLKMEEVELEKKVYQNIENIQKLEEKQSNENDKWKNMQEELMSWATVIGGEKNNYGGYYPAAREVADHLSSAGELSDARVKQGKSLGKRIAEWRELSKKIEHIAKKMQENEEINEGWKKTCQKVIQHIYPNEKSSIETPEACQERLATMNRQAIAKTDETSLVEKSRLDECVQELNQWEEALEMETTPATWFEYYLGQKSIPSCESARQNVKKNYENNSIIREGVEKIEKIEEYKKILKRLGTISQYQNILKEADDPVALKEWKKWGVEWENVIKKMEEELNTALEANASQIRWKIIQPEVIWVDKEEKIEWAGELFSNLSENVDYSFVVSMPNPGIEEITSISEGVRVWIEEKEIILEGETIPADGIGISGEGKGIAARASDGLVQTKIIGNKAFATQTSKIETAFPPVFAKWKINTPAKEVIINKATAKADETKVNTTNLQNNIIELKLVSPTTTIEMEYEINNAIRTETTLIQQKKEWEKTYTEYQVLVENSMNIEIEAAVYTGVYGDPSVTESILTSNENGEKVMEIVDATGNIVLPQQKLLGKQKRKYSVIVEKWDGIEEWMAVVERLWVEADGLQKEGNETIAKEAGKMKETLAALRGEKDTVILAQKLTPIQTELSKLTQQFQNEEKKWAELENEWITIRKNKNESNAEWIKQGDNALAEKNEVKLEAAIEKIGSEKKILQVQIDQNSGNNTNRISEARTNLRAVQIGIDNYEKSTNVGCEKMALVNFVCPLPDNTLSAYKKVIADSKKMIDKMETKIAKLSVEKQLEEWAIVESEWGKKMSELNEINSEFERGLRALRNGAVERVEKLKQETNGNSNEEIQGALAKAVAALENEEFGKSIFITQNMLNYLSGNKVTGLVSFPNEAWPFIGIIFLVGIWLGWKEWKKRNEKEIPVQMIPKGKTIRGGKSTQADVSAHPPTLEGFQQVRREEA